MFEKCPFKCIVLQISFRIDQCLFDVFEFSFFSSVFHPTLDADWEKRWIASTNKGSQAGKFRWSAGKYYNDPELDKGTDGCLLVVCGCKICKQYLLFVVLNQDLLTYNVLHYLRYSDQRRC